MQTSISKMVIALLSVQAHHTKHIAMVPITVSRNVTNITFLKEFRESVFHIVRNSSNLSHNTNVLMTVF